METLKEIKELMEKMCVETTKVYEKGNKSACVRARKYAIQIKQLIIPYRKELKDFIREKQNSKKSKI